MKKLATLLALYFFLITQAAATITCSLPFTLTNGTTADATQVMANYNALVTCFTQAASAGVNNDITQLTGLTSPIPQLAGGSNVFIGGTSTGSANSQVIATATPTGFALTQGWTIIFKAGFTNSGATQINVNSTGLTNVFKATSGGPVALIGGEIVSGQLVIATYDGTQFEINPFPIAGWGLLQGTSGISLSTTNPPLGYDACSNLSLAASVGSNLLTITFTGNNGATPSATNPILCSFRDVTLANGDPVWVTATSALSINTNAVGATLGSSSGNIAFRFWIVLFNNGGSLVPALINCLSATQIFPLVEQNLQSTTGISAAATSAGVFYTPNGTTLSSKPFKIVGYLEYGSGLGTAGTYASAPTIVQLFGPGIKKPGDIVQTVISTTTTNGTTSSSTYVALSSGPTIVITPTSAANLIQVQSSGTILNGTASGFLRLSKGTTAATNLFGSESATSLNGGDGGVFISGYNLPNSTSATTYAVQGRTQTGTITYPSTDGTSTEMLVANEIMSALEPANDNEPLKMTG